MIRKAEIRDLDAVDSLYREIHDAEAAGLITTGWIREIYPVRATAEAALARDDLFVLEEGGHILGSGIINQLQVDVYEGAPWKYPVPDDQVCVLHTLVISPAAHGKGYGREWIRFYEDYALQHGCTELRIDTNERNLTARAMYSKYGYQEIDIVPTTFNGIPGVNLVLLEKQIQSGT
jgi:GNAT superfamily N-acetyltransferase